MTEQPERPASDRRRRALMLALSAGVLLLALLGCGELALWQLSIDSPWIRSPYNADYAPWDPLAIAPVRAAILTDVELDRTIALITPSVTPPPPGQFMLTLAVPTRTASPSSTVSATTETLGATETAAALVSETPTTTSTATTTAITASPTTALSTDTATATRTPVSFTATSTLDLTATETATATDSSTPPVSLSDTPTSTVTPVTTATTTWTPSVTPTLTETSTPSQTATASATATSTRTLTRTMTSTTTSTATSTATATATTSPILIVNSTGDGSDADAGDGRCETTTGGECTLRAALQVANAGGVSEIRFGIPVGDPGHSGGVWVIRPTSALPGVSVNVNGQTQPGWSSAAVIEVNGSLAGGADGLTLNAAGVAVRGLAVTGFGGDGVQVNADGVVLEGNLIGERADGSAAGNGGAGVYVAGAQHAQIGGGVLGSPALRNVIGANAGPGVWLADGAASNSLLGNFIGTDPSGGAARANASGVVVTGPSNVLNGNVISGNSGPGVSISGFGANGNILSSNVVGLNAGANAVLGNGGAGVALSEGPNFVFLGNVIAGNGGDGIWVAAGSNVIRENYIGTNASGTGGLGNVGHGIGIASGDGNIIGGTSAGIGNVVLNNGGAGVRVADGASGNSILGNSLEGNAGLGIDLGASGVNANDGALSVGAANRGMDYPVLTSATWDGSTLTVGGYVGAAPGDSDFGGVIVELYVTAGDGSGFGEGQRFIYSFTTGPTGDFSISALVLGLNIGDHLSGTATNGSDNTSEFGPVITLGAAPTATPLPTATDTPSVTWTPTSTVTLTPSATATWTPTATATLTPSATGTPSETPMSTSTATDTAVSATATPTPAMTNTPLPTETATPLMTATATATLEATATPSETPTATGVPTITPTITLTSTPPSALPTSTATALPSDTPTLTDTPSPTPTETPTGAAVLVIEQLSGLTTPEYVIIQNTGSIAQDLTGWSLFSVVGSQSYSFPAGYVLDPGASVQIQSFTGAVDSPPSILLWSGAAIWNNSGDKAELLRPDTSVASSVCYLAGCP